MTSIECREQTYMVRLENGTTAEYVLRGLNEDEVKPWSEFCASVFSYKKNPPSADYFYRHYANDPTTKVPGSSKLIRVATFEGSIVASCRVFLKQISTGNKHQDGPKSIVSGGIGEVCTNLNHRRRGISKKLLQNAIAIMEERSEVQISSLHAAPTFFPLYESLGYSAPPASNPCGANRWSTVDFCWEPNRNYKMLQTNPGIRIRPAEFPNDTKVLQTLHSKYSEENLVGCILRSEEYWNEYLSKELEGSLYVLESNGSSESNGQQIVSWLSLGGNMDCFSVREFGVDTSFLQEQERDSISMHWIVGTLIVSAIEAIVGVVADSSPGDTIHSTIKLPGFVSDKIRKCKTSKNELVTFDWESEQTEIDRGWMYRGVGDSDDTATVEFLNFLQGISTTPIETPCSEQQQREHFVWPSDSF